MKNISDDQVRRSRQPAKELPTTSTPKLLRALLIWIKLKKKYSPSSGVGEKEEG
ncbi:hypothetical protein [Lewinella cohaerens]|uniref:hypothetical protein n=1 Tax=Lewinella cohaerens TaxID=70995 RepID=UPI000379260F|nr:hypothetical protein [Lewinella cohaerens]